MKVGICAYNMTGRELLDLAVAADDLGFDGLWLGEHVLEPVGYSTLHPTTGTASKRSHAGPVVSADTVLIDPLLELAAVASRTRHLLLGTAMYILPLRHPLLVARAVCTLQALSGDRLWLGVGAGWLREEFDAIGVDFETRRRRFDEMTEILRVALAGGEFSYRGQHFDIGAVQMTTEPVPLPLVYAGNTDGALRRAARLGDAWFASGIPSFEEAQRLKIRLAELADEVVRDRPLRTVFRVDGSDPEVIRTYVAEGLDDLVVWADRLWHVGDSVAANSRRLEEMASALQLGRVAV